MEVPSSKEKKMGGSWGELGARGERGSRDGEGLFDAGRYLRGSAEQLSISDKWLSFESAVFKALFGRRQVFRRGPSEQTCSRTASLLPRPDQCLSDLKGRRE